jgi:uncharacterized protein YndB with AHSA1/START domain
MMPVKKDASGRRYVEAQAEVPGTPEEVWQAIATGPGISSWFVPSRVEERAGGAAVANFGPGMESTATITEWDPPRRFAMENREDMGPGSPTVATEWTVESRAGGTCVVRVVHSWFATSDDWDSQFEGHEQGWVAFFRILRVYLTHYRGQPSAMFQALGMTAEPVPRMWERVMNELGLAAAAESQYVKTRGTAPPLTGRVERAGPPEYPELLVKLDEPTSGAAHLFALAMGGQTCLSLRVFFYGDRAGAVVAREEPRWQAWMNERFPSAGGASVADKSGAVGLQS